MLTISLFKRWTCIRYCNKSWSLYGQNDNLQNIAQKKRSCWSLNTVDYDLAELEQRQYSNQYQSLTRYSPVCSTSHTRKRRFMLVPGPPLLYRGFAFYNWDILVSKKTDFSLTLWQEQSFPFAKVKRRCWLSAGWPVLSAKIERSHLSIHNFLHPAL